MKAQLSASSRIFDQYRITGALGIQEARQDPGDEDDGDTEQDPEMGGSG
jgi:hypothetical protein